MTFNFDGYFLEYDTERAGGLEPLRFLPKGTRSLVVGLITLEIRHAGKDATTSSAASKRPTKFAPLDPACALATMRLCFHRGRQRADRKLSNGPRCAR